VGKFQKSSLEVRRRGWEHSFKKPAGGEPGRNSCRQKVNRKFSGGRDVKGRRDWGQKGEIAGLSVWGEGD